MRRERPGRRGLAVALLALAFGGCSDEPAPVERPPAARAVLRAQADISLLEGDSADVEIVRLDVTGLSADAFRRRLEALRGVRRHVWMPGVRDWLLVASTNPAPVSLARAMERFAADEQAGSVAEVFASYVGTVEEILPAFESKLVGEVLPQWFVTKEIPDLKDFSFDGLDADIADRLKTEIRSSQFVRRMLLKGNMLAENGRGKEGEREAVAEWAKVFKRNPRDPMLQERVEILRRNAQSCWDTLRIPQAMKCYETLYGINPNDASAVRNFGLCLKRIGKTEMAEKCFRRAEELSR